MPSATAPTADTHAERLFAGLIGEQYDLLRVMLPESLEMSLAVGQTVARDPAAAGSLLELGCGTGVTTLAILSARADLQILALDNEPTMLRQAEAALRDYLATGTLALLEADALTGLRAEPTANRSVIASAYTLHNFEDGYRNEVLAEIHRVLRPGGLFVNGDRYALDDLKEHTRVIQAEIQGYFSRIGALGGQYDVLEQWIVHLYGDEAPFRIMRTRHALAEMERLGFTSIQLERKSGINALLTARRP